MAASVGPLACLGGFALAVLASGLLSLGPAEAEPLSRIEIGQAAPSFTAMGADGRSHSLSGDAGKIVVLEWTSPVCPFTALKYDSGAMQALQRVAARRGVVWLSIDTAAPGRPGYLTPGAARARIAKTHATVTAFLSDPDGKIGRAYGAKATPSFFVIDTAGRLAYQGAMTERAADGSPKGPDLVEAAIDDLKAGRPVATPETEPYGCAVEY
jgi:peroxiredoxin